MTDGDSRRAVFLDRDGVINHMVYNPEFGTVDSPQNPDEFELMPGAGRAVRMFNEMELLAIVVSNQPGIAKGKYTPGILQAVTDKMNSELAQSGARLDGVYYCRHHPQAVVEEYRQHCDCRKPKPGLLLMAAREFEIDLSRSYMIGDGITDILAGQATGSRTFFIGQAKCYVCAMMEDQGAKPDFVLPSLADAASLIQRLEREDQQSEVGHRL